MTDEQIRQYLLESRLGMSPQRREHFAETFQFDLGIIDEMQIGVDLDRHAWVFPMFGADGDRPIGFRLRSVHSGKKWALKGSRSGCFYAGPEGDEDLWVVEGPTDAAALACLGMWSIGLPSINSGYDIVRERLVRLGRESLPERIVWVVERDEAGLQYEQVAVKALLKVGVPVASIMLPPAFKDVRDWYEAGATKDVLTAIVNSQELHYG